MANEQALEIVTERFAWEQQEGEPDVWYERFCYYRQMRRSMRSIQRAYREQLDEPRKSGRARAPSLKWAEVAKEFHWKARAEAWDIEQARLLEAADEAEREDGLALAHERIRALKTMAAKLEQHLLDPKNSRLAARTIEQYRGLLDDLAREVGHRAKETHITGAGGGPIVIETQWGRGGSASSAWDAEVKVLEEK